MVVRPVVGQSLVDLSLQYLGGVEGVMDIVKLNPGLTFVSVYKSTNPPAVLPSTILTDTAYNTIFNHNLAEVILPDTIYNQTLVDYYRVNNITVINI